MVTAIVIPIICLYFYWLTKKEMRENYQKWIKLNDISEEAIISGVIVHLSESKQRFYYHRYVHVLELTVRSDLKKWKVKKITPLIKEVQLPDLQIGEYVNLYGNWKEGYFLVNRVNKKGIL